MAANDTRALLGPSLALAVSNDLDLVLPHRLDLARSPLSQCSSVTRHIIGSTGERGIRTVSAHREEEAAFRWLGSAKKPARLPFLLLIHIRTQSMMLTTASPARMQIGHSVNISHALLL